MSKNYSLVQLISSEIREEMRACTEYCSKGRDQDIWRHLDPILKIYWNTQTHTTLTNFTEFGYFNKNLNSYQHLKSLKSHWFRFFFPLLTITLSLAHSTVWLEEEVEGMVMETSWSAMVLVLMLDIDSVTRSSPQHSRRTPCRVTPDPPPGVLV